MRAVWMSMALSTVMAGGGRGEWLPEFEKELAQFPGGGRFVERETRRGESAVRIQGFFFDAASYRFRVVDNPSPHRLGLGGAAESVGAVAAVNGGYFHADYRPVGLMIADGEAVHGFERAKLLSGVFVVSRDEPRIERSDEFAASGGNTEALQAGPFLVEAGRPKTGLEDTRLARRTVVATDGQDRWAILLFSRVTLAQAANILADRQIFSDFPVQLALNLDGGSSSALWVRTDGKPFYLRELTPVRNFLAVVPK